MRTRYTYTFEGQPAVFTEVRRQFPAYCEQHVRAGLLAGHTTREALLLYLSTREVNSKARQGGRKAATPKLIYCPKPKGM